MTTPQHPGNHLEIRSSIGSAGAFTLTATDLPRDTVQSIIGLVLQLPHSLRSVASDVIDELPDDRCRRHPGCTRMHGHGNDDALRPPCPRCDRPGAHKHPEPLPCSVCGRPGLHWHDASRPDDYVDQGDEPHEPDNGDRIDPWAHPKHDDRTNDRRILSLG